MKIKFLTSSKVKVKELLREKDTDEIPRFYSSIELMIKALKDCEHEYKDKYYEFFTGSDVGSKNITDVSIVKIKWLRQTVLVCAESREELYKFDAAFNQVPDEEWQHEYLDKKIKNLEMNVPDNHKNLKKATLRDISTFDFGNNLIPTVNNSIYSSMNQGLRYLAITANNVFWMDQGIDESDTLIKSWEKYKK